MIFMIGGVSHTGKTYMAQWLLEQYKIPYLSIDHLKMGLYRSDPHCGFTPEDSTEIIAEKLWPLLKGILMTNVENGQHLILEGCYLMPERIAELDAKYLQHTASFYLFFSKAYIEKHFDAKILRHRCVIEARGYPNEETIEAYTQENERQREICEAAGARYFVIDEGYEAEMEKIHRWIDAEWTRKQALLRES